MDQALERTQPLHGAHSHPDPELEKVASLLIEQDPDGSLIAAALRRSIDMLLDGQHTGRFRWDQLYKTEKTHAGTLVEINLQRAFGFAGGRELDYHIGGTDVDCKYSQTMGGWMIPPEAVGKVCLLLWASDQESRWCAGLARPSDALLNSGGNRDSKRSLNSKGRAEIYWLFPESPLQPNILLRLSRHDIDAIFAHKYGTQRVDELLRRAQGRRISRNVIATVAKQDDYMKRLRGNGGSRTSLRPEGIIILGQYSKHCKIAAALGVPVPGRGESVSARVVRLKPHHGSAAWAEISGERWTLAVPGDEVESAPLLPKVRA